MGAMADAGEAGAAATASNPMSSSSNRIAQSSTPVDLLDDHGQPVLDANKNPLQRPSDVPPGFFVDAGRAAAAADAASENPGMTSRAQLWNFRQSAPWDVQRVGPNRLQTPAFVNYATIGIGLYGAAARIPLDEMLTYENWYAGLFSRYPADTDYDPIYTHLPRVNVDNTKHGYQLYESGQIGPSSTK